MRHIWRGKKIRLGAVLLVAGFLIAGVVGCNRGGGGDVSGKVTLSGSTALLPLVQQAKEGFEQLHQGVTVNVSGGGSFTGLNQVLNGAVEIGNADVSVEGLPEFKDAGLVDHQVAVAPFVIVTHPGVKVVSLTQEQLIGIFTGEIKNWQEVGGANAPISIIHRPASSGSRAVIKQAVLKGREFTPEAVTQDSNGAVREAIATTPNSIGYLDAAYLNDKVKTVAFGGVSYSPANVYNGSYPIYAFEHMYTKGEPQGAAKAFLDYIAGDEFQSRYVEKLGFLPLNKMPGK